jgi:hypothetical protein
MRVAEVVYARIRSEAGCFTGRCPDAAAEPVTRDMLVALIDPRRALLVPSLGAPVCRPLRSPTSATTRDRRYGDGCGASTAAA